MKAAASRTAAGAGNGIPGRVTASTSDSEASALMRIYLTQLHYEHFGLMLISGADESEKRRKWGRGQCGVKMAKVGEG